MRTRRFAGAIGLSHFIGQVAEDGTPQIAILLTNRERRQILRERPYVGVIIQRIFPEVFAS